MEHVGSFVQTDRMYPVVGRLRRSATVEVLEPRQMTLSRLIRQCACEYERFQRSGTQDTRYAYEIFRRALVERDDDAWSFLYQQYHRLVERWVRRCSAFETSRETSDYFVTAAFARFWQAIPAGRFGEFPTVAALLHYLQCCAASVVIDSVRRHQHNATLDDSTTQATRSARNSQPAPEEQALDNVARAEFWSLIESRLRSEAERVVLHRSFVLGMKPGDIYSGRPDLFRTVGEVYALKRNLLERLGRDVELRRLVGL
jgi:DNA-directed RNA polymerase specialized sigma24 family protein